MIVIVPADTEDLLCAGSGPHGSFVLCAANKEALGYLALAVPFALGGAPLPGWDVGWFHGTSAPATMLGVEGHALVLSTCQDAVGYRDTTKRSD